MAKKRANKRRRKSQQKAVEEEVHLCEKRSKTIEEGMDEATTSDEVEQIVALLSTKKLVVLQGPHGCGKTYTAKLVARRRNVPIKVLQINDQYDSKVLFGNYNCSEVPGEFVWQPSKFAQFLQQDCVILLENLDHGGSDLAAAIVDMADRGHAVLANGRHIGMDAECRILGTISREEHQQQHIAMIWRDYPFTVRMASIQLDQIDSISAQMMKTNNELLKIRAKLLQTFANVAALVNERKPSMDRALNANDLFRLIKRLISCNYQKTLVFDRCALFAELFDAWAAHLSGAELRRSVAAAIGEALSLSSEQQHYHMDVRFPELSTLEDGSNKDAQHVQFGRVVLERRSTHQKNGQESQEWSGNAGGGVSFVLTRDAAQLLERVAACVSRSPPESVLLTGDTGVGKTATVQHLARLLRVRLHVVNLSQESEFSDLVGGHKPTSVTNILRPMVDEYISLFRETFNVEKNAKFLDNVNHCFNAHRFADLVQLVLKSSTRALHKFTTTPTSNKPNTNSTDGTRRNRWTLLLQRARRLATCFRHGDDDAAWRRRLLFAHVKGVLTESAERGDWLLVDEINLAPAECMDALIELLDTSSDFTVHPDFRLFACMNSANDVGKRLLPLGIRSAFTEFFVDETRAADQLRLIIRGQIASMGEQLVEAVLQFYNDVQTQFPDKFNLRTLSRALAVANGQLQLQHYGTAQHCLSRACAVAFVSQLDTEQRQRMQLLVTKWLGAVPSSVRNAKLSGDEACKFILIEGHKIPRGDQPPMIITTRDNCTVDEQQSYIFTPSVHANMALLASVVATGHFPILMEGETSAGKTSMVMQLAKMSGNRCFRINNHEHTDIQEYIGSYAPDAAGRLEFVEGVLLRAVRNGDWIILDELNLAPSAVLEALNRLLDDNRELFVSELNITVRAHPRFRLFATQNPVGTYAGRKRLSRAFLSRFMCLQWDALPHAELPQIVQRRCGVSPRMAELMAAVLAELKVRRAIGGIFACSDGLMTLRDLFRWGHRMSSALMDGHATDDWRQALADQGYFVLGTRCRTKQDEQSVVDVLQRLLGRRIDASRLFSADSPYMPSQAVLPGLSPSIVLTTQLRRMLILCAEAWRRNEPVLLVGETGCGKTTAVHQFGDLLSINCHERTDAADLLGSIRPISAEDGGGFRWRDGIVLQAMRRGQRLLVDEISLAPDSVLERLNSLLEPQRTILLTDAGAKRGSDDSGAAVDGGGSETVTAADGFQLVATMNPGNDHGKKELSKALRNRFTEVWCPAEHEHDDLVAIVCHRLVHRRQQTKCDDGGDAQMAKVSQLIIKFNEFFNSNFNHLLRFSLSTRDLVTLSELFTKFYYIVGIPLPHALYHAIEANVLDALGVLPSRLSFDRQEVIDACIKQLHALISELELVTNDGRTIGNTDGGDDTNFAVLIGHQEHIELNADALSIGPFRIEYCEGVERCRRRLPVSFSLNAPTTRRNVLRVARALASSKPVMLEGSPGAGKSSLVVALAAATGHRLVRLNLSEQTDLYDLFGSDVPVTGPDGSVSFTWRDGPVLTAIKEGCWILLDEMNLASQSVLEGLNSCFDFRKHIYIAELDRTFTLDCSRCKFFACQNPHQQGGDRRALPKSFLNRFISIYVEEMTDDDFICILCEFCKARQVASTGPSSADGARHSLWLPSLFTEDRLAKMVLVNKLCRERVQLLQHHCGGPFEFNLRDLFRWVESVERFGGNFAFGFELIYLSRLTKREAREKIINEVYNPVFGEHTNGNNVWMPSLPILHLSDMPNTAGNGLQLNIGCVPLHLCSDGVVPPSSFSSPIRLLATQLGLLEHVSACVSANWLVLLTGPPHVGKRSTVRTLATLVGQSLEQIRLTSETDALELLGSFEQIQDQQHGDKIDQDVNTETMDCEELKNGQQQDAPNRRSNLRFEWVDSVFVRAFRDGHWLLVEDVNCCSSAVLDCLNSCLESADGELVLPVQQQQTSDGLQMESKIRRHANFRIFFTMNPKNGQLSRAMRNRSVELSFGMDSDPAVEPPVWSVNVVDMISAMLLPGMGLLRPSSTLAHSIGLASPKQSHLVGQLQHKLQRPIECSELLCCAAQLPHRTDKDCSANHWPTAEQQFLARVELFIQLLYRNAHVHDDDNAVVAVTAHQSQPTLLGLSTFPPVTRPCASTLTICHDELTLYYWHCWNDVSTIDVHAQHPDVCLQLAFMFPGSFNAQKRIWPTALQLGLFWPINESCQRELFSLLSTNIMVAADCDQHQSDMAQLLFDNTFPAEMRRWPDPRKLAVNDSEIGQKYLATLRASLIKCRPFRSVFELEQYRQRWCIINSERNDDQQDNSSIFNLLGHHFVQIIHFLNRIFDDEQNVISLPWLTSGDNGVSTIGRMFEFGRIGSTEIGQLLYKKDGSQLLLFPHLQLPFITFGLISCFWSRLHFDDHNIQRHLRLVELNNASAQLDHAFLTIWQMSFARKNVHSATKNLLRDVASQIDADIQTEHQVFALSNLVAKLTETLTSLTPPRKLMDPPHFAHLQQMHWRERLHQLDVYLNALRMFLQLTNAKSYDIEQLVTICCSACPTSPFSSAPILKQLCSIHSEIVNALRQLNSVDEQSQQQPMTVASNDDELCMYRCCWTEGQESDYANHFRYEFVERLRTASAHLTQAIGHVIDNASNLLRTTFHPGDAAKSLATTLRVDRFHIAQQNLRNLLSTISTLKALLTKTTTTSGADSPLSTPTLFIYPDLVAPYLHVLNLLSMALADFHRQIDTALSVEHIHHKYGFSRVEFNGFIQLLYCSSQLDNNTSKTIGTDANNAAVTNHGDDGFVMHVKPFIHWLITADQMCPLTVPERLPICLWSIAALRRHSKCRSEVLGWILRLWESWHEQNARIQAQEQLTVVRRKRKRRQTGEEEVNHDDDEHVVQMETEDQKLRAVYLPDFSNPTNDADCEPVNNDHLASAYGDAIAEQQPLLLSRDALHDALCNLFKTLSNEEKEDNAAPESPPPFISLLNVLDKLELYTAVTHLDDETLAYPHLLALDKLREQLQLGVSTTTKLSLPSSTGESQPLNVYRDSEPSALVHCVQSLTPLRQRVQQLLAEFPENGQLSTLFSTIDTFVHKASAGAPLMKHAAQLENILVRAEEWESIADRAHSVRQQMVQLQELLVEWRRREVHCWAGLVNMMRADCAQLAVLAGWPLFKCAMDTLRRIDEQQQNGADGNTEDNTLILAFVDWMHNATIGDFDARLWTGHLLTKCLHILAPNSPIGTTLCRHIRCTWAHFAQFGQAVQAHFAERFSPVERALCDFCRAVRYTDLNVWSVRDSARRAHTHLVRILRSFKNLNEEPVFPLLFEKPSPPLEWVAPSSPVPNNDDALPPPPQTVTLTPHEQQRQSMSSSMATLTRFVSRLEASVVQMLDDGLDVLRADTNAMFNELQTNIIYESVDQAAVHKDNVQLVNEKRHGRALFSRQQRFARLVRAAAHIGLNARRAQHIDSELLTMQTVAETDALYCLPEMVGTHFRHSTAARNVFLRQFATFRRHNSSQQQQLTPATLQQLRSIVEYTLHWMQNAIVALGQQRLGDAHRRALHITRCIALEAQNAAAATSTGDAFADSFSSSHACMSAVFVRNGKLIGTLNKVVDRMRQLHRICPRQQQEEANTDLQQQSHSSSVPSSLCTPLQTLLGSLRQASTEHAELHGDLSALEQLLERLKRCHSDVQLGSVCIPDERHLRIWRRNSWQTYIDCLRAVHCAFSELSLAKLSEYFVDEFAMLSPIFDQLLLAGDQQQQQQMTNEHLSSTSTPEMDAVEQHQPPKFESVEHAVLLYLQSIYKDIEQHTNNSSTDSTGFCDAGGSSPTLLDSVKRVLELINKLNSDKMLAQLYDWFLANSSVHTVLPTPSLMMSNRLTMAYALAHGLSSALCHLHHHIGTFVSQLASFHAHWCVVGCHLLTNGFVNSIPVVERNAAEAEGKRVETGDGFGDADLAPNATDVSSQVENMEQIEGLKENTSDQQQQMDEQNNDQQQQSGQKMPEVDQPIDVEDDFAGCLEGLDMEGEEEGVDDEDNDHQREDIDDRADWNFGEVEEPEETQLDPQLWEPPAENNEQQRLDDHFIDQQQQSDQQQWMGESTNDQQQQQSDQNRTDVDQPIDVEDNFDGCLEGLDMEEEEERVDDENVDNQREDIDDRADSNFGEVEEPEETQLDQQLCESPTENDEQRMDKQNNDQQQYSDQQQRMDEQNNDQQQRMGEQNNDQQQRMGEQNNDQQQQSDQQQRMGEQNNDQQRESNQQHCKDEQNNDQQQQSDQNMTDVDQLIDVEETQLDSQLWEPPTENDEQQRMNDHNSDQQQQSDHQQWMDEQNNDQQQQQQSDQNMTDVLSDNEKNQLFAYASATLEQAQRTRALFNAHLRRFHHEQKQQQQVAELDSELPDTNADACQATDQQRESGQNPVDDEGEDEGNNEEQQQHQLQLKWALITDTVAPLAAELAESLRAIIEPTIASRLEGDYRTGKRLNMRRLIPYIASDYRKDRIWMRRTRKARRNYQICIAVDNSQSMQHNHMTEITCNALCLIERALRQLEVGELALCSFGSQVQLIADFAASEHDISTTSGAAIPPPLGVRILRQLRFDQSRTDLGQLLDVAHSMFTRARDSGGAVAVAEQLLIILGDGRGVFSEGAQRIQQAIARLFTDRVTVLFLVMDVPPPPPLSSTSAVTAHKSIMDMRIADFSADGQQCTFRPYMAQFPFPLYALVRDTCTLPATVAETVRQWFEHIATG